MRERRLNNDPCIKYKRLMLKRQLRPLRGFMAMSNGSCRTLNWELHFYMRLLRHPHLCNHRPLHQSILRTYTRQHGQAIDWQIENRHCRNQRERTKRGDRAGGASSEETCIITAVRYTV